MYLKDENKKMNSFKEFEELYNLQEKDNNNFNIAFKFFKYFVISNIENLKNNENYNYSISEKDINKIADNLVNNDTIWEIIDEHIGEELSNYEVETYKINDKTISEDELKAMFNFVYGKDNKEITKESLQNFLKDILDNTIYVTICDDERDLIWRLFVEDEDKNGIIDNFEFVLEKAQEGFDYKKDERVLEYNNRYFIIQW